MGRQQAGRGGGARGGPTRATHQRAIAGILHMGDFFRGSKCSRACARPTPSLAGTKGLPPPQRTESSALSSGHFAWSVPFAPAAALSVAPTEGQTPRQGMATCAASVALPTPMSNWAFTLLTTIIATAPACKGGGGAQAGVHQLGKATRFGGRAWHCHLRRTQRTKHLHGPVPLPCTPGRSQTPQARAPLGR